MAKKKTAAKAIVPRCPVDGCKLTLQGENREQCDKCGVIVCKLHKYPVDHHCGTGATPGSNRKPPAAPGATISVVKLGGANAESKEDSKKKSAAKDEEILAALVATKPEELLNELMAFGSSSARYESSTVVQAMCSEGKAVHKSFLGPVGRAIVEVARAQGQADKLLGLLDSHIRTARDSAKLSAAEEKRSIAVCSVYGLLLEAMPQAELAAAKASLDLGVFGAAAHSEKVGRSAANEILKRAAAARWGPGGDDYASGANTLLLQQCDLAIEAAEENDRQRNGGAFAAAAIAAGTGSAQAAEDIVMRGMAVLSDTKDGARIMGGMRLIAQACKELGAEVAPFLVRSDFVRIGLFEVYDKVSSAARGAVKKALLALVDKVGPRGVRLSVPVLLSALDDGAWRVKQLALQMLGTLGKRKVSQLFRDLAIIVPAVMECVKDTKKQVSEAAADALDNLGGMITNAETLQLMPWLLKALKDPEQVELCLDELMDTTFVNSIDAQSLSMIIPVVLRGLRDGTAEVKLKASITTGNVCSLVADVHDMRPFVSSLMPELKKLQEHSRPRVREHAIAAKQSLQEDMALTRRRSSHDKQNNCMVDLGATSMLNGAVGALELNQALDSEHMREYVLETARMILFDMFEDLDENFPRSMALKLASNLVSEGLVPLVRGAAARKASSSEEATQVVNAFRNGAAEAIVSALFRAQGRASGSGGDAGDLGKDYIVYLPSIILAFASKLLLKRTGLFLERGERYAVVGMNGVGKTTLLNRIAARNIDNFPEDVSVYYVQHEIMEEDKDLSVAGYMERDLEAIVTAKGSAKRAADEALQGEARRSKIKASLDNVGFSAELQQAAVANLSGGWRMRLAIARSMLYNANLLLLDEPTNHLDVEAIGWLQRYLTSLTDVTIVLVSHDYDFVDTVSTAIIHLADQKLTYYPCTFKEFQKERPDIVAALPKKDDNNSSEPTALDLLANAKGGDAQAAALAANIKPMHFPEGCKLNGIAHRGKPIASMTNVSFCYPGTDKMVFNDVSVKLTLNSRVALLGPNGAGKSTLLKLLVGELELDEKHGHLGKLWKHQGVRIAYIAQHSMHHLESSIEQTPCQYIQARFWEGQDKEASKMITVKLTDEDQVKMTELGEIAEIVSRVIRTKKLYYEVRKNGRQEKGANKDFRSLEELEELSKRSPHVIKLVRLYDEKIKMAEAGVDLRPLTTPEMIKHLEQFGISSELAQRKIRWMSGGQKSRLVLAAALWTRPHVIVLDEPTNYLDNESLAALTAALKAYRGGVLLISHHEGFVAAVCKEHWDINNGSVKVTVLKKPNEE